MRTDRLYGNSLSEKPTFQMDHPRIFALLLCLLSFFAITNARKWVGGMAADEQPVRLGGHIMKANNPADRAGKVAVEDFTAAAADAELSETLETCNESFPISMESFAEFNKTGMLSEVSRETKCYLNCVFTKIKLLDDAGNVNVRMLGDILSLPEEDVAKMSSFKECFVRKRMDSCTDPCELNYDRIICLSKGLTDYKKSKKPQK